jgi:hypothetical protein
MQDMFNNFMRDYKSIKQFIKDYAPEEYERWKAGGSLVDDNVYSMYPSIGPTFDYAIENFIDELDKEDQDDTIEESNLLQGSGE